LIDSVLKKTATILLKMKNKKIPVSILDDCKSISPITRDLFYRLWLSADEAGCSPLNNHLGNIDSLAVLKDNGLLRVTDNHIILSGYLASNYSPKLKPDYNPHKRPLSVIESNGYRYDAETGEIDLGESEQIALDIMNPSLNKLDDTKSAIRDSDRKDKPLESEFGVLQNIGSIKFALVLAMLLTLGQSFHTGYSLYIISDLPEPYNICFAVFVALLLDALIVFFVVRGSVANSMVFLIFSTAMNLFALHHSDTVNWFHYTSYFAILVSLIIPYSIHAVASMVHADRESTRLA